MEHLSQDEGESSQLARTLLHANGEIHLAGLLNGLALLATLQYGLLWMVPMLMPVSLSVAYLARALRIPVRPEAGFPLLIATVCARRRNGHAALCWAAAALLLAIAARLL